MDNTSSAESPPGNEALVEPRAEGSTSENTTQTDPTVILVADSVITLDPYRMVSIHPEGSIASHLWDTLTLLDDDLQVEPHLAESWRLINNFTWEFKLRENLNFHNGEPLNAEAVRFSIERAQTMPGSVETFANDVNLEQVDIIDDYTLRLTTDHPVVNLPYHLAFLEVLPPVYYSETDPDQVAREPMGSGPYRLAESWTRGQPVILEAIPTYWQGTPRLSQLVFETVPLAEDRLAALRRGDATVVTDLPPLQPEQWDIPNSRLEAIESTQRMFIGIRTDNGETPLADKQVRQALNYGVNIDQILDDLYVGVGERYGSWVNSPSNNPELDPWPYDPELARQLLTNAGYSQGFTVTLRAPAGRYYRDAEVSQTIAQQLGEIGITVQVETVSNWGVYVHELLAGDTGSLFLLGLNSHADGLEDTWNLSVRFPFNLTGWQNASFEETLSGAATTFNEDSRARLLNEAQAIAYDEAPWIWLWNQHDFYGISQTLAWMPRRDGIINLYESTGTTLETEE